MQVGRQAGRQGDRGRQGGRQVGRQGCEEERGYVVKGKGRDRREGTGDRLREAVREAGEQGGQRGKEAKSSAVEGNEEG